VGQSEVSIHQDEDEVMNQLVVGAFFLHPDEGLSICKEWIQVMFGSLTPVLYFSVYVYGETHSKLIFIYFLNCFTDYFDFSDFILTIFRFPLFPVFVNFVYVIVVN